MRLIYMGAPDFAVPALAALIEAGHEIAAVYTQPPRPAGRGKKPRPTPVGAFAEARGLAVRTPLSLKGADAQAALAALNADAAVVAAYGLLLPQAVLDAPRHGCWNLHASLLPRWRGAAPIHRAVMAGDAETGVCVMRMEAGLDTGPVALTARTPITAADTTGTVHDRLAEMGAPLIVEAMALLAEGRLATTPQPAEGVYAPKIDKAEARIDWTRSADDLDRHIRGLSPFPGAWFEAAGERVKALMSETTQGEGDPGQVLAAGDALTVACGSGALRLTRLQRAGKAAMPAAEALRGMTVAPGDKLS